MRQRGWGSEGGAVDGAADERRLIGIEARREWRFDERGSVSARGEERERGTENEQKRERRWSVDRAEFTIDGEGKKAAKTSEGCGKMVGHCYLCFR